MSKNSSYISNQYFVSLRDKDIIKYMFLKAIKNPIKKQKICSFFEFDEEIIKIPFIISEPMLGFIRLAWWQENIFAQNNIHSSHNLIERIKTDIRDPYLTDDILKELFHPIELILEKKHFQNFDEFFKEYIAPTASVHAKLLCNILEVNYNNDVKLLYEAFGIIAFIRSWGIYKNVGWDLHDSKIKLTELLIRAEDILRKANKKFLKASSFKIIYIATEFFLKYYLKHTKFKIDKIPEPNYGILKLKLLWGLIPNLSIKYFNLS